MVKQLVNGLLGLWGRTVSSGEWGGQRGGGGGGGGGWNAHF